MNNFENISKDFIESTMRKINLDVLTKFASNIQTELNGRISENNNLLNEIDKLDMIISQHMQSRLRLMEETNEKKSKVALTKKEIEIKRSYLNSIIKSEKIRLQELEEEKMGNLGKLFEDINSKSKEINQLVSKFSLAGILQLEEENLMTKLMT